MLIIKNIEKAAEPNFSKIRVNSILKGQNSQMTYDILYTHDDYPNREFLVMVDRETQNWTDDGDCWQYPLQIFELGSPKSNADYSCNVWETNLKTPIKFIDFIELVTNHMINQRDI